MRLGTSIARTPFTMLTRLLAPSTPSGKLNLRRKQPNLRSRAWQAVSRANDSPSLSPVMVGIGGEFNVEIADFQAREVRQQQVLPRRLQQVEVGTEDGTDGRRQVHTGKGVTPHEIFFCSRLCIRI